MSAGGSMGLAPNNFRAWSSSARTSFSCSCSPESATSLSYPGLVTPTIHCNAYRGRPAVGGESGPRLAAESKRALCSQSW